MTTATIMRLEQPIHRYLVERAPGPHRWFDLRTRDGVTQQLCEHCESRSLIAVSSDWPEDDIDWSWHG
jgi:hypothetical protein